MQEKDVITIEYLEDPVRFADLINGFVFQGEQRVSPGDITELNRVITKVWRKSGWLRAQMIIRDLARMVHLGVGAVVIAVENQSDIHYAMPVRIMNADGAAYEAQWKQLKKRKRRDRRSKAGEFLSGMNREDKLIPCFTIVIYFGEEPWDGPRSLKDMLALDTLPAQVRELVADYPMRLLEVRRFSDLDVFQTDIRYVFGVLQKAGNGAELKQYVDDHGEIFENLDEEAYDVISMMSHSKELKNIKEHNRTEKGGINMCKAIKELIAEGINQGIEQGMEQGIEKGIEKGIDSGIVLMKTVLRFHAQGYSYAQIAEKCDIPIEKVKYILDDSVA